MDKQRRLRRNSQWVARKPREYDILEPNKGVLNCRGVTFSTVSHTDRSKIWGLKIGCWIWQGRWHKQLWKEECGNKDHANENRGYLFRAFNSKAISHHHLYLADIKKLAEELESFTVKRKRERERERGFSIALIGYCEHGEARDGLARMQTSYVIGLRIVFGFLWLVWVGSGDRS